MKTGDNQYDLILQNDLNACGYTQWFYFTVRNTHKNRTCRFNIVNLVTSSLFSTSPSPSTPKA